MGYMKLLCLLGLLHAAAAMYDWYGVVKLSHSSEYDLTIKTLDETMHLYIAEVNEGAALDVIALDTIVDGAEAFMDTYCTGTAAHLTEIEVDTEKKCVTLTMNIDTTALSTYELHIEEHAHRRRLSGDDVYFAIFARHGIDEWEDSSTHFLKCGASAACGDVSAGADIELECVGDVEHAGHAHGHRRLTTATCQLATIPPSPRPTPAPVAGVPSLPLLANLHDLVTLSWNDNFGVSVAVDGDTVVVGAQGAGVVYVFRTTDGGATYAKVAELKAPDDELSSDLHFGYSVAIQGGTVVVGTDVAGDPYEEPGSVYIYRTSDGGNTYVFVQKLQASEPTYSDGGNFGSSVAIDGGTVAISGGGYVYIFRTTDGGGTWSQVAKLVTSEGVSISRISRPAIAGDVVVAGAPGDDSFGSNAGSVYVFNTTDGGATYDEVAKLGASDAEDGATTGASSDGDTFGSSVAIEGNTVVVGAEKKNQYTGAAYVYRSTDGGATYVEVAILTAADGVAGDMFGASVAIKGDTIAIGATQNNEDYGEPQGEGPGAVYIFRTTDGGATYTQVAKLTVAGGAPHDAFGGAVAMDGVLVAGAKDSGGGGSDCTGYVPESKCNSGSAYVFSLHPDGALGSDAAAARSPLLATVFLGAAAALAH